MPGFNTSETFGGGEKYDKLEVPENIVNTSGLGQYDEKPLVGLRRLLKHNPSLEFCLEVVQMNKEELDPAEVRKVGSHYVDCCTITGK